MQTDKPIKLILDCPLTGRTVITHLSEEQLDMFIESCTKEMKSDIDMLIRESKKPYPKASILTEEERYFL